MGLFSIFFPSPVAGHPKVQKAAVFDIISPDLEYGAVATGAEILAVASDCLDSFPNLAQNYDIHISHSKCEFMLFETKKKVFFKLLIIKCSGRDCVESSGS